jgi:hypothetical protein
MEMVFQVHVDGRQVAATNERSTSIFDSTWPKWEVDLSDFENRRVDLELTFGRGPDGVFYGGCWADPFLVYGTAGTPVAHHDEKNDKATRTYRMCFLGHGYSFNGFDKTSYGTYAGFDLTRYRAAEFAGRFEVENDGVSVKAFYSQIAESRPDRLVWGGDAVYQVNANSIAHFTGLVNSLENVPQVLIPGNHDYLLLENTEVLDLFRATANATEILGNVRFLYVNTVSSEGLPFSDAATSQPDKNWVDRLVRTVEGFKRGHTVVILMHHAPWIEEPGRANVSHGDYPWWNRMVHPSIVKAAQAKGCRFYVIAGDGGTGSFAEGRVIDGVHYVVTGQPRFDDSVPNGFIELTWNGKEPGISVLVHTWRPETGFTMHKPTQYPWRF